MSLELSSLISKERGLDRMLFLSILTFCRFNPGFLICQFHLSGQLQSLKTVPGEPQYQRTALGKAEPKSSAEAATPPPAPQRGSPRVSPYLRRHHDKLCIHSNPIRASPFLPIPWQSALLEGKLSMLSPAAHQGAPARRRRSE